MHVDDVADEDDVGLRDEIVEGDGIKRGRANAGGCAQYERAHEY